MKEIQSLEEYLVKIEQTMDAYRINAKFHDEMRVKYERAARFPWERVPPDPPEPDLPPKPGLWVPPDR